MDLEKTMQFIVEQQAQFSADIQQLKEIDALLGQRMDQASQRLDRMEAAIEDRPAFLEADLDFHLAIGNAAHNRILMNALHLIRNLMRQWIAQTLLTGASELALKQHKQIFLAMAKRSPERAREAMTEHLTSMAKFLLEAQQNRLRDGREQVPAE